MAQSCQHTLAELTTEQLDKLRQSHQLIVLLPVGSVEPHGPHLPLSTDTIISEGVAARAAERLCDDHHHALIAPAVPYGVTDYAHGFAGAISIPSAVLTSFLAAVIAGYLAEGLAHVCLINNHLEPEHDQAVRAAIVGFAPEQVSVACPLTRRWGRTLSAEYKSGACHAGRYETSLVMAVRPDLVRGELAAQLPALDISLATGIRNGQSTFAQMGIERAYTGAPALASTAEGDDLMERLASMVVSEVREAMAGGNGG